MQAGIRKRPVKWVGAELVVLVRSWVGSAGPVLRSQEGSGEEELSRCRARD